nr:hypothetical protein BgiMline_015084 [Biomphalaria glabrata]
MKMCGYFLMLLLVGATDALTSCLNCTYDDVECKADCLNTLKDYCICKEDTYVCYNYCINQIKQLICCPGK